MRQAALAAFRRAAASAFKDQLKLINNVASQAGVAASPKCSRSAGLAAALAGGALINYGFGLQGAALAEAPAVAAQQASAAAPTGSPYDLPAPTGSLPQSIVLYQYEVCPFCCKVKAFLDFHKLPYRVVEVNPLTKAELKWSEYKKVPVVLLDGKEQLNDSSAIISRLAAELAAAGGKHAGGVQQKQQQRRGWFSPRGGGAQGAAAVGSEGERRWREWVDARLVRVITVNIYRNARESWQTFDYIANAGNFSWVQREAARVVGATLMWGLSKRLRKKYHVEGDVRQALYVCADEWVEALGGRAFLGGEAPDLADLAVFGVVRSVVGTDTFMDLQHNTRIAAWYERMVEAVGGAARLP